MLPKLGRVFFLDHSWWQVSFLVLGRFEYCTKDEAFARGSNPISPSSSSAPQFFGQDAAAVGEAAESYSIEMKNYSFAHLACYEYQWNPFVILNAQVVPSN